MTAAVLSLPDESLIHIFRYLHFQDLTRVSCVCSRFHKLTFDDSLWRWQCSHYFLKDICPKGVSWRQYFENIFAEFGRYKNYRKIKTAWQKIEDFVKEFCPSMLETLCDGLSEEEIDWLEEEYEVTLPEDFRLSYRLHNGQSLRQDDWKGIFGSYMIHNFEGTDILMPLNVCLTKVGRVNSCGCIPFIRTFPFERKWVQMLAVTDEEGYEMGKVYHHTVGMSSFDLSMFGSLPVNFVTGETFLDWLCKYAEYLQERAYYVSKEHIYKFYHEPSCVAVTNEITVKPTTCFIPGLSTANSFFFSYRIIMSMPATAPERLSCQLERRHWVITDGNGHVETVSGEGVVGTFPVMKPGAEYSWVSCTSFSTVTGSMEGHFTFRILSTGERTRVICPRFEMRTLPVWVPVEDQPQSAQSVASTDSS